MLFQTGYLTIKHYNKTRGFYVLAYPNNEVRISFLYNLLEGFSYQPQGKINSTIFDLEDALYEKDFKKFMRYLKSLFAAIPYEIFQANAERYYQSIIYVTLRLLGIRITCEVQTNVGRIDGILETENCIYIMEFKMTNVEAAMTQISKKEYYTPYLGKNKEIYLLAVAFDRNKKNIGEWQVKKLND